MIFLGPIIVAQLKVLKGGVLAFFFFFFFYSLLSHPNACVFKKRSPHPPEKSKRKTIWSDAGKELKREIHKEDNPVRRPRKSGSLWCTLPSINPFHPLPQFHSSPTHDSTPWNLKWMAVGNWDTREREVELAWTQNPKAKKKAKPTSLRWVFSTFFSLFSIMFCSNFSSC